LVQDKMSSIVYGMPGAAIKTGCADEVVPLGEMGKPIAELAGRYVRET